MVLEKPWWMSKLGRQSVVLGLLYSISITNYYIWLDLRERESAHWWNVRFVSQHTTCQEGRKALKGSLWRWRRIKGRAGNQLKCERKEGVDRWDNKAGSIDRPPCRNLDPFTLPHRTQVEVISLFLSIGTVN